MAGRPHADPASTDPTLRRIGERMAARPEIIADDGGYYLLRLDADGVCVADTWHASIADAQDQARAEYGRLEWRQAAM